MNLFEKFAHALPYSEFMARHGTPAHDARWRSVLEQVRLDRDQLALLSQFTRVTNVLVLAGTWCGDCANECPIFERFAEAAPVIRIRYIDRDVHADAQEVLQINGGNRVPVVVFFSEDGFEVSRYGDRTLSRYREMASNQVGASCSTGIVTPGSPILGRVTNDWLNEFERVQWLLRLSPRLRQKHHD